ncbi:MAG TPA: hypothetical protein PK514_04625 [Spirochaetota bacterium]|nr:hypothetical protein [Spirochaetota bacterium]
MKVFIKKLILFFIILTAGTITACNSSGSGSNSSGETIDVSGTYNVTITENGESLGTDIWILKQTGNDVAVLLGEAGAMTVSGSNLIIAWEGDEVDEETGETVHVEADGTLAISGDTISGTVTWTGDGVVIATSDITMTRTSTSAVVPEFNIPEASITVDGVITDWASVEPYVTDAADDATEGTGTDIESIKIARDSSRVYLLVKTDAQLSTDYEYRLEIHDTSYQELGGIGFGWSLSWQVYETDSGQINVIPGYVELSFPYSGVFTPGEKYIVEQKFKPAGGDDSVDEADFTGYTILPVLE